MNNIHIQRKRLVKTKLNYIKKLNRSGIDISLSSLSSFSRLMFAGVGKTLDKIEFKNFEKKINLTNFIYQIKNFLRILKLHNLEIIGNYSKNNINIYKTLIVSWSSDNDFKKNGEYFDRYFQTSSNKKGVLWFLIHVGNQRPFKVKKNIIILYHPNKTYGFNLNLIIKYFYKILRYNQFSLKKIYHELSFDSFLAHRVKDFFELILNYYSPKKIIFPYESQVFQNSIINLVRKNKRKIVTIGYNHSLHPFPIINLYHSNSPDFLYVNNNTVKKFYLKYFKWPTSKVKKISSFPLKRKKKSELTQKVFLPYHFSYDREILKNFDFFLSSYLATKIKPLQIKMHPTPLSPKKHLSLKKKIEYIIKKNKNKFSKDSKKSVSIHIGEVSTVIESLEVGIPVIHIVGNPIFELFSSKFWPNIIVKQISDRAFEYLPKNFSNGKFL